MVDKQCDICKKELINVHINTKYCNDCKKQKTYEHHHNWYLNNKKYVLNKTTLYYHKNKDKNKKHKNEYYEKYYNENKEQILNHRKAYNKIYNKENRGEINKKSRKYYYKNRNKVLKRRKNNKENISEYNRKYIKHKYHNNVIFKLRKNCANRISHFLRSNKIIKNNSTIKMIGCSPLELKQHLENQFQEGMNWDNHSLHGWHIDHIIPLSSANTEEEMIKLCHYTNLQPLWAKDNLSKGNKF